MIQDLARKAIEAELTHTPLPSLVELGATGLPEADTKSLAYVTLYADGVVIASTGRIHNTSRTTLEECFTNARIALLDPRAIGKITLETLPNIKVRVDIINGTDKRVIQSISEINPREEGIIFISQNLVVASVVLPRMCEVGSTPETIFNVACKKAGVTPDIARSEYVLYAIKSTIYSDF